MLPFAFFYVLNRSRKVFHCIKKAFWQKILLGFFTLICGVCNNRCQRSPLTINIWQRQIKLLWSESRVSLAGVGYDTESLFLFFFLALSTQPTPPPPTPPQSDWFDVQFRLNKYREMDEVSFIHLQMGYTLKIWKLLTVLLDEYPHLIILCICLHVYLTCFLFFFSLLILRINPKEQWERLESFL